MPPGDIRKPRAGHKCRGPECCSGAVDAAHKLTQFFIDAFSSGWQQQPSTIKWYTFEDRLELASKMTMGSILGGLLLGTLDIPMYVRW